nr:probable myosin light chain kinase DDB_G0271550 isoform X4 [Halyomorpha halys]
MRGVASGVSPVSGGFLSLSKDLLQRMVSAEPIGKYFWIEDEPFARGKYAAVRRCRELSTGREFAAKSLKKKARSKESREEILHEVAVLEACRSCSRIVSLHKVFESSTEIILVLELARGGELQMLLDSDEELPTEAQVQVLMRQILEGIIFLHGINVAHLDIKPQNLILTGPLPSCEVKLCDFGISRHLSDGADVREILGTPDYVAPEVLNYEPISLATDMWSVGVLLYVLLTGCSPFGGDTKQETFCNISQCRLDFPEDLFGEISEDAKDLMTKLMVKNPSGRLTAEQCIKHAWFSKVFSESSATTSTLNVTSTPLPVKPRTPIPAKRTIVPETIMPMETRNQNKEETKLIIEKEVDNNKNIINNNNNNNNNNTNTKVTYSRGLSEERRRSLHSNLQHLIERLDNEEKREVRLTKNDSFKRASATQTMPPIRYRTNSTSDLDQTVFKFKRVVVVDEDEGLPPSIGSSADNSCDSNSDTISEMSIDSSSDRSSIISLDDTLDFHYGKGLRHYSSCLNVWEAVRNQKPVLRPVLKECNESFVKAMSRFKKEEENTWSKVKLRSSEDRRFSVFNPHRLSLPQTSSPGRKSIGLEFVRETNGNLVVIREVKAIQGKKYSRTSELKCESVQSRIRKLEQIKSEQLENSIF